MKIFIFLFSVLSFGFSVEKGFSQDTKIVFDSDVKLSVEQVFEIVKKQTDLTFIYKSDLFKNTSKINVSQGEITLRKLLMKCKSVADFDFQISKKGTIYLKENPKKINSLRLQLSINGTIMDQNGQPLPGANIVEKGTSNGVTADFDGNFSIDVADNKAILVVSYVGFTTKEVALNGSNNLNIVLEENTASLEEIVVVGYGTQKKGNVTGSISSIKAEDIAAVQSPSFDAALQGTMPGVYVTSNGGQPGGGISVRIRGAGSLNNSNPLYVIDGIVVSAGDNENFNPMATINPNDIETIDVLKDAASAAIYGARAANGVVLITTKRGKVGKPRITLNTYAGIQQPASKLVRPLNATEFGIRTNQAFTAAGEEAPFADPASLGKGVDYLDEVVNDGYISETELGISGGTESHRYYVSLNYFDNDGIMLETYFKRMAIRVNTDNQISKNIKIGNSLYYSRNSRFDNNTGTRNTIHGTFTNLYQALPTQALYDESTSTGYGGPTDTRLERRRNPVSEVELPNRENASDRVLGNVYAEIDLLEGLQFKTSFSANIENGGTYSFTPIWEEGLLNSGGLSTITQDRYNSTFWSWENTLTYTKSIGKHNFVITGGTSAQESTFEDFNSSARYDTSAFTQIVNGAQELTTNSSKSEESLASVFGRLTYDFDNKYLLTAAVRRDGSSKFGPNNKFGVFPSLSAGWRISQEDFFKSDFISDLKIRGGWGQVGSDAIGNFRYLATLNTDFGYAFGNQTGVYSLGAAMEDLANPGVKWETATEYNFGLDTAFMDNRLTFSAEYYNRTRTDMLMVFDLSSVSGLNTTVDNVGELVNKGFEFSGGFRKVTGDFRYDFNANLSTINSEVVDLGGVDEIAALDYTGSGTTVAIRPGEPLGVFLGRRTLGIFQTQAEVDAANAIDGDATSPYQNPGTGPGDFKWKDLNGDGRIDNDDKEIIGNPIPKFTYGFGGHLSYKQVDFNFQFFGVYGNDIFNIARSQLESSGRAFNKSSAVLNAWNGPGTSNTIPRAQVQDPNGNVVLGDNYIEDGSYLRLKNLNIGYSFSKNAIEAIRLSSARIYLAAQNVFVITKFSGADPEVGLDDNNSAIAGIYTDLYPQVRTLSIGLNVGF